MPYSNEQKLEFECQKLEKEVEKLKVEVRNIQRPFFLQPATLWGAIPVLISMAITFQQCSKTRNAEELAKIDFARTQLDIELAKHEKDSLNKAKEELAANIALAKTQLQSVQDSITVASTQISELASRLASSSATPQTKEAITDIQQTVSNINQVSKYAVANIDMKNSSFKISAYKNESSAKQYEEEGYKALIDGDVEKAISAFTASENAYNGYHQVYELARYLRTNTAQFAVPDGRKDMIEIVLGKFSGYASPDIKASLKNSISKQ